MFDLLRSVTKAMSFGFQGRVDRKTVVEVINTCSAHAIACGCGQSKIGKPLRHVGSGAGLTSLTCRTPEQFSTRQIIHIRFEARLIDLGWRRWIRCCNGSRSRGHCCGGSTAATGEQKGESGERNEFAHGMLGE
jgi:hypothetical protein